MAEIRINATGGVKLYDADDSHYAQIIAGTISSNVDVLTLGSSSADFNIPVKVLGTTPTLTIGDAGAEDTKIVFDGNAQDFYIALDDSADDLLIGLGSTVGTTPAIAIDENLKVNIPVTTASTSASTGSLTTGGGAGIGADLYVGDDVYLITDSAVLGFGADKDTTLTHTDGTGLTLNSTNKLCFNDASQFIQGSSGTVLSIGATDEIDLTATAVDLNGTLNVSGVATFQATPVFPDGSLPLADLDIDGGTDIGAAIVDADLFIIDDGAGGTNRKTVASRLKTYIGAPVLLATTDGAGAGDITFNSGIDSTYRLYMFDVINLNSVSDAHFRMQWENSGGLITSDYYKWAMKSQSSDGDDWDSQSGANTEYIAIGGESHYNDDTNEAGYRLFLNDPSNTTKSKVMYWTGAYQYTDDSVASVSGAGYYYNSEAAIIGVKFYFSTGNIETGTIKLYGIP